MGRSKFPFLLLILIALSIPAYADNLPIPGGTFAINWHSDFNQQEQQKILDWLLHAAHSASLIDGRFPRQNTNIIIRRHARGTGPVPWANTIRHSSPEGVNFYVNPQVSLAGFTEDWTAVHEFSHLYIPYVGSGDIWISEGFASYYQNILMARAGTLSVEQMWQKLADGFRRGANDSNRNIKLGTLSADMRQNRAFMRVYWSGALYFLEMNIALQNSGQSLDAVISEFRMCCRSVDQHWNGIKLAKSFDRVAGTSIFATAYKDYESDRNFRGYTQLLSQLGIELDGNKVVFTQDEQQVLLRSRIVNPGYVRSRK
ncbi:MAG: hypothetical protein ABGY96_07645 [bacterium]|nr:hypothetical protein [Gammaproteobacteria bacterium]HIL96603.1 hypothetical protein [Pseudomonadales bacterium]